MGFLLQPCPCVGPRAMGIVQLDCAYVNNVAVSLSTTPLARGSSAGPAVSYRDGTGNTPGTPQVSNIWRAFSRKISRTSRVGGRSRLESRPRSSRHNLTG